MEQIQENSNNSKLTITGDPMLTVIKDHPDFISIEEYDDGENATCVIKRHERGDFSSKYGIDQAVKEKSFLSNDYVWEKLGPMIRKNRARRLCVGKAFPELSKGAK